MKLIHYLIIRNIVALAIAYLAANARAQLVPDGGTNIVDGVTNSVSGDLTVGTNGSFTLLSLTNAAEVDVNSNTFIGRETDSFSNAVKATGPGARLTTTSNLYIGSNGWGNQLTISEGSVVSSAQGSIGFNASASNNSVTLTGANSIWTNSSIVTVGEAGSFNLLTVNDGTSVFDTWAIIGNQAGAKENSVLVSGIGSRWINSGTLTIGSNGSFSQLIVNNGGVVANTSAALGVNLGANSNLVLVTGIGSLWRSSSSLVIGGVGSFNQLIVSNGGVVANTSGILGNSAGSDSNLAVVAGIGALWAMDNSVLNNVLVVGNLGSFNQLYVTNGGSVRVGNSVILGRTENSLNNSVLAVGGSLASAGLTLGDAVSRNNSVTLLSNSTWNLGGGAFKWGDAGINDRLIIDATSSLTKIGGITLDENNTAFFLTNAPGGYSLNGFTTNQFQFRPSGVGAVIVGNGGTNVQLIISNYILANTSGTIGNEARAISNSVVVTGTGSLWSNSSSLTIGASGSFNQLIVSNGGVVRNTSATFGSPSNASHNNLVLVTDGGSLWSNSGTLTVGNGGASNQLVVSNGGMVRNTSGTLGSGGTSGNNAALITGANSLWTNSGTLIIGSNGAFNQLVISNSGVVRSTSGSLGSGATSSNNVALVTGAGSLWSNSGTLTIGNLGSRSQLTVSNGGTVFATNVALSLNASSTGNRVTVDGGTLRVTNAAGTAALDIRRGTNVLNAGLIVVDRLVMNNVLGVFEFNGGTLNVRTSTVASGQTFIIGNGSSAATFNAAGVGTHTFANGLLIQTNATLTGTGTINGNVTNCGTIFLTNADQLIFTGPLVNKGVIIAVTGTPRFGSTFSNLGTLITTASINVANVSVSGQDIALQFNSVSNYLHEVQASTNVSSGVWQSLTNGLLGTGSPMTFTDPGGALSPNRTYRVLLH